MKDGAKWAGGLLAVAAAGFGLLYSGLKKVVPEPEGGATVVELPLDAANDGTIKALPVGRPLDSDETGQGQWIVVLILTFLAVCGFTWVLTFIVPPAFAAAGIVFGPVLLSATVVAVLHLRAMGLSKGDPPQD